MSRNRILILVAVAAVLAAAGGWVYARRAKRIEIAAYVPESALGYLEVNDWPGVVDRLTATEGWKRMAPAFGIPASLQYTSALSGAASLGGWFSGPSEMALLARAQVAVVVTGLEVRGEEIKPLFAVLAETHGAPDALKALAEKRMTELAQRIFGPAARREEESYAGVQVLSFRAADAEKRLLAAQIGGELIVANDPGAMRACVDARLGRAPSLATNFHMRNARPLVERDGSVFGFVTGDGITRLLRFGAYLLSGGAVGKAALAGAVGEVFTDFSTRAADGVAFASSFESGGVVDRYALLFKPEFVDTLKAAVRPNANPVRAFDVLPPDARNVTVIHIDHPMKTLEGLETAVSSRVGAGQSFLLHQFAISAREALFGVQLGARADEAIGDEIVSFDLPPAAEAGEAEAGARIWLVASRDTALTLALVEKAMVAGRAVLAREKRAGVEILHSSDDARGAAAFLGDFVALGRREHLIRLIDAQARGGRLTATPQVAALAGARPPAPMLGFDSVSEESLRMMEAFARWTAASSGGRERGSIGLPLVSTSVTRIQERGLVTESRSPFGNFPFMISLVAGAGDGK